MLKSAFPAPQVLFGSLPAPPPVRGPFDRRRPTRMPQPTFPGAPTDPLYAPASDFFERGARRPRRASARM